MYFTAYTYRTWEEIMRPAIEVICVTRDTEMRGFDITIGIWRKSLFPNGSSGNNSINWVKQCK